MANIASARLAVLESALRARKLDRTLTSALPALDRQEGSRAPTHVAALDAALRGGLPRGQLSEIAGPPSSGRTALLLHLLAAATGRGELVALVDTFDRLDVASAVAAEIDPARLLWVRGQAIAPGAAGLLERTVDRALKAFNLVLQAGGFGVVALDVADVPPIALSRLPPTTWLRVQRVIEGSDTACVLVAPHPVARSAGGVSLALGSASAWWEGASDRSRRLGGVAADVRLVSPRRAVEGTVHVRCVARA